LDHVTVVAPQPQGASPAFSQSAPQREIEQAPVSPVSRRRLGDGAHAAFMLMVEVASLVRSWSALISSCNVASKSFAASFKPSS
jgi:hypothetical protein